jgi:hypothetical protein
VQERTFNAHYAILGKRLTSIPNKTDGFQNITNDDRLEHIQFKVTYKHEMGWMKCKRKELSKNTI